jgi:non-ribosomal peptide synthetase component F
LFSSCDDEFRAVYGTDAPPEPRTLVDIVLATIAASPDAVALVGRGEEITYQELGRVVERHAQRLWDLGIGRGDRVGVRVPSGTTDLYVAVLSVLFAGAAYVPVDWDDPDARAQTVWEEAGVAAVFGADLEIELRDATAAGGEPGLPSLTDDAWIIFTSGSTGKPKGWRSVTDRPQPSRTPSPGCTSGSARSDPATA